MDAKEACNKKQRGGKPGGNQRLVAAETVNQNHHRIGQENTGHADIGG